MDSNRLLIIIATFNEAESLPALVDQLQTHIPSAKLLVIDDNSPDGTGKWATSRSRNDDSMDVMVRDGKLGLGSAAIAGFHAAVDGRFTWAATLDADLSHDPASLKEMFDLAIRCDCDLVIGSRYVSGGQILGWPLHRRITSFLTNTFARFVLGLPTRDNTSAMRIYRVKALDEIPFGSMRSSGYSYLEEILLMLKKNSAVMQEYPITFQNRELGKSKADLAEIVNSLGQILSLAFRRNS